MQNVIEIINTTRQKIDKVGMQFAVPYTEEYESKLYICLDSGDDSEDIPYSGVTFTIDIEEYLKSVNENAIATIKKGLHLEGRDIKDVSRGI